MHNLYIMQCQKLYILFAHPDTVRSQNFGREHAEALQISCRRKFVQSERIFLFFGRFAQMDMEQKIVFHREIICPKHQASAYAVWGMHGNRKFVEPAP